MTLREKTLLTTSAILVGMIALLYLIANLILGSNVAEEERQSVSQNVARAVGILDHEISGLASIASDWGAWDDTYAFIENGDEAYVRSNLVDSTFADLRLNLMLFVNSSGRSVYAGAFDLQNQKQVPVPSSLMEQLTPDNPLLQHPDLQTKTSGIILLPEGPLLVAANPILTSNEQGPVHGTVIMGRFVNEEEARLLPELTRSSVQLYRLDDPRLPRGVQTLGAPGWSRTGSPPGPAGPRGPSGSEGSAGWGLGMGSPPGPVGSRDRDAGSGENLPLLIQSQNNQLITGYTLLRDIYGKPALGLSVDTPRSAHELAQASLLYLLSALLGVGLLFVLANRAVLNGFILSRLDNLSAEIQRIGLSGDLKARLATTGKDELTRLAEHINEMLGALEYSQQRRSESEQRYRAVVQETADGIFLLDIETKRILEANAAFQNMVGYTAQELAGLTLYDLVAHDRASIDENAQRLLAEKRLSFGERKYRRKSGSLVEVEVSANLTRSGGKEVACVIVRDVTRRKWAEDALRRNEAWFRALIDNSLDVIGILNADGTVCYLSPAVERMLGFKPERLMGRNAFDMIHSDDAADVRSLFARGIGDPNFAASVEFRLQHQDGSWVNVEVTSRSLLENPAVMGIVFSMRDITARKRAEQEVRRRAEESSVMYETTRDLAVQSDVPNLLSSIVERATDLLKAPCGFVYLYDAAQRALELTVEMGMAVSPGLRLSLGEGMAGIVAQTLQPLIVDDYHTWEHQSPQFVGVPYAAVVEVPMLYGGELIGVLGVSELGSAERKFTAADARLLSLLAGQAAGAVHNANLLQQTRARAEQLALLYDAGLALNSVLEPRAQLEFLFKIGTRTLRADRAEFFRYDSTRSELCFELGVGYPEGAREGVRELPFALGEERGLVGLVAQERIPKYLPDVASEPRWVNVDPEIQSALMVPVEHENQLLGVLSMLSKHTRAFTPQDERLLVLFANQAAVALENARLFEETRRRADQLAILNRIASTLSQTLDLDELLEVIHREINAALHADAFFIALYDEATGEMNYRIRVDEGVREPPERRRLAPGLTAHVIYNKKPLLIRDWEQEKDLYPPIRLWGTMKVPRAWLNVPMLFRDTVVGVISLQSYRANAFGEDDERLLATIADQAAVAVEKARLFAETEHRLQRLHALGDIDKAISSSLDLRVTLEVVLEQVSTQLHVDAADILLHNPRTQMLSYGSSRGFRSRALQYTELRLGEGLAGTAALERRILHYPDLTQEANGLRRSPLLAQEGFVAYFAVPLIAKGEVKGVLEIFHRSSLEPDQEWLDFAQALGAQAAIAIDDAELFQDLQRTNVELTLAYDATIEGWARALELRDQETEGHSVRVTELTVRLARVMGMKEDELLQVRRGTVLHDIGKMAIPDSILFKPGKLSAAEWEIMQRHPTYAYEMLSPIAYLRQALDIPYCHHEKWDGTGYPRGLKGEQIPLAARIFAVVDVWDALCSDRRYRAGRSEAQARAYIREQAGRHFDPKVVEKFLEIDPEMG